ncbi:glutathione S-transferase [Thalassococcus sp. S3]|nr:glutathione S-transferase family protein [Thalassococcus sp. S3]QBF33710.1 glutathione S-transferase [Thalassococcus sp. S3]
MTLHYAPGTIAAAVAITLNEVGADYDSLRINFSEKEQRSAAYLAINPKGRVPALGTPQGVLTETSAILDYVAATHPQAGIVPADPFRAAQMRSVMTYLASTMHVNHAHGMRGARWADEESSWSDMRAKVSQTMSESAQYIETYALQGRYVLGDTFSLADPYLFMVSTWLAGDGVDIGRYPRFAAFQKLMWQRPSVRVALSDGYL